MLCRPKPYYNELNKVAICYKNPLCLTRAKEVQPALYNGHEIIKDNHARAIVHNTEDTLEIAEISRKKMNDKMKDPECVTRKRITPTGLTEEERGFEQTKECYLKQVISFFKTLKENFEGIQKALTKEIKEIKDVFEELEAEVAQIVVDRKHDAIERKNLLISNDNLIAECLFKEVFSVATNSKLNEARFTEMHVANTIVEARCLKLKAELANLRDKSHHDNQEELIKYFSKLEVKMDDLNITMEEYIRLEEEKARRRDKVYNWKTATYGKIWYNEDVHDLKSVETEFPAIVHNDVFTSEVTLSCEPTSPTKPVPVSQAENPLLPVKIRIKIDIVFDTLLTTKLLPIRLEEEKACRRGKVYNGKTAMYGKIWDNEDVHDLRYVEIEFPAIVFNETLTSEATLSCEPMVSSLNDEIDFRFLCHESDNEDWMVIFDKNSFSYKIIAMNNMKMNSENDNEKVNMSLFHSPGLLVSCFDDLDFFNDFENEFPAIVYNNAPMSKSDLLTEPTLSPQHID
nr:retrovirus-related Pol polyprotein from transposon TNT 1-94 [Tanacetum cinerariifolium]